MGNTSFDSGNCIPMNRAVIAMLCLASAAQVWGAVEGGKSFYRWTDKEGKVHYGDRLPPEQTQLGGVKYDASGIKKQSIEGARTPEQLEAAAKLKHLHAEQARLFAEQADRDQALLRSFRNEEEVRMALQGNLNTLNAQVKVIQANLQRQQEKLAPLQQQADAAQKAGKQVPKGLADNLATIQHQVTSYQSQIVNAEKEKQILVERAETDVARLKALKTRPDSNSRTLTESAQGDALDLLVGAVPCLGDESCGKGWSAAQAYLQKTSAEPLFIATDRILRTMEPVSESGFALTVVRIAGQTGDTLFLDVRCSHSSIGQALCASSKSQDIRQEFRQAVAEAVGLAAQ